MCIACVSIGKRPFFDWLETNGYLSAQQSSLPKFAKPSGRLRNFWADLALESAMIVCFTEHTFMIPLLAIYYAVDAYYYQAYVNESLHNALVDHFLAHGDKDEVAAAQAGACGKDGELCQCDVKLPENYAIAGNDNSVEAHRYRQTLDLAEQFSTLQYQYMAVNAVWSFTIITATLLLAPEASAAVLLLASLVRYPITSYLYDQQTQAAREIFGDAAVNGTDMKEMPEHTPGGCCGSHAH